MSNDESWNYFESDVEYTDVLMDRLENDVAMVSALGLSDVINLHCNKPLSILDFGSGPGHYFPVMKDHYHNEIELYHGVDIVENNVNNGNGFFENNPNVKFSMGDVMLPENIYKSENCIISANTLPHVPTIDPLLDFLKNTPTIEFFFFRMLIGSECVQIKKHLNHKSYKNMFSENYQHNNIYSLDYIESMLGDSWSISIYPDRIDEDMLANHSIPRQKDDPFYSNRVSRFSNGGIFKGEVFMPWKYISGVRVK